jgi:drug/metabolite transporter (DMT)-like permease
MLTIEKSVETKPNASSRAGSPRFAVVLVVMAAALSGTTGTAQALGHAGDPVVVGAGRLAIGGGALVVITLMLGGRSALLTGLRRPLLGLTVIAAAAGTCYGVYTTAAKALLNQGVPATAAMAVTLSLGALLLIPVLLVHGAELTGLRPAAMLAWLGLVATAGTYLLFARGLTRLPAATVATLNLAEPLIAAILGLLVLGERPGGRAAVGALSLLAGLVLAARRPTLEAPTRGREDPSL